MKISRMLFVGIALAAALMVAPVSELTAACTTIQSGLITDTYGNVLRPGYDQWGYNYQAHMFNGLYENFTRPNPPATESDTALQMKWSDPWLSNKDCDGDGKLDRGLGTDTPGISQGWLTNHMHGTYEGADNETHNWTYFVKIVYMPSGCPLANQIWGLYCIIEEVYNDPYSGFNGVDRSHLINPAGLGYWTN